MDKVAIVILNWNGARMLEKYLPSVLKYSPEAAVYVADNASTDDSMMLLESRFPEVRLVRFDRNWGFAEGYNKALGMIEAEYYMLLNSDVEVTENWLGPLLKCLDENEHIAACQPKLRSAHDHSCFEYAGASGGYLDKLGYPFCRGRIFETVEKDMGQYDDMVDVMWATGAALLVRARDYNMVGGLDGRFFAHNEEIDFCWRLNLRGRRIVCVPDSHVYHVGGGTLPKSNPMKTFYNFRNNLTMLYKCLPEEELRGAMILRYFLDYLAAWEMLLLKRNIGDFRAVYRARRAFRKWKHDFDADRRLIQENRVGDDKSVRRPYLLLWQYYAKGHKRFSELP